MGAQKQRNRTLRQGRSEPYRILDQLVQAHHSNLAAQRAAWKAERIPLRRKPSEPASGDGQRTDEGDSPAPGLVGPTEMPKGFGARQRWRVGERVRVAIQMLSEQGVTLTARAIAEKAGVSDCSARAMARKLGVEPVRVQRGGAWR
jgi:hypothetical protein